MKPQPIGDAFKVGDIVGYVEREPDLDIAPTDNTRWLLLQTEPNREFTVTSNLTLRRVPFYVPTMLKPARISASQMAAGVERPDVARPIFPGLVFLDERVVDRKFGAIVDCIVVSSRPFMQFGDSFATLSPVQMLIVRGIELLERERRAQQLADRPQVDFKVGDEVRVCVDRLLGGKGGRVIDIDDDGRITLLMDIMKRKVRVRMTADQVVAS